MMQLSYHGGKCCGIKTIHNLGINPSHTHDAKAFPPLAGICDGGGECHPYGKSFFTGDCPEENAESRFKRYIEYFDNARVSGLVEVTTSSLLDQTEAWSPVLEGHGFKAVTTFKNSNSGRMVTVWHRTVSAKPVVKAKTLAELLA